jgi:hypothetical protein
MSSLCQLHVSRECVEKTVHAHINLINYKEKKKGEQENITRSLFDQGIDIIIIVIISSNDILGDF